MAASLNKQMPFLVPKENQNSVDPLDVIATGSMGLDHLLETGGYVRGRLVEISGKHDVGKTTLALAAAARAHRAAYIDTEQKLSEVWKRKLDVGSANTVFFADSSAESALDRALSLVDSGKFDLVVIDSVAALIPDVCFSASQMYDRLAELERVLERSLPLIARVAAKNKTCVLITNQMRRDPDTFSEKYTGVGGQIMREVCSVRLNVVKHRAIKANKTTVLGGICAITLERNVFGAAYRTTLMPITYARGLDPLYEAVLIGQQVNLIREKQPFLFRDHHLGSTELEIYESLAADASLADAVLAQLQGCLTKTSECFSATPEYQVACSYEIPIAV